MTGKIAIVRYGGNFRGLKVKAAQDAGAAGKLLIPFHMGWGSAFTDHRWFAVGCIIYSDPAEDGEGTLNARLRIER